MEGIALSSISPFLRIWSTYMAQPTALSALHKTFQEPMADQSFLQRETIQVFVSITWAPPNQKLAPFPVHYRRPMQKNPGTSDSKKDTHTSDLMTVCRLGLGRPHAKTLCWLIHAGSFCAQAYSHGSERRYPEKILLN